MKFRFRLGLCFLLASSLLLAQTETPTTTTTTTTTKTTKRPAKRKTAAPAAPSQVETQINSLRDNLAAQQQQMQQLRDQLAQRDQAIQQAQQQLQQLQNAASAAQTQAATAQATAAQATEATTALQSQVTDLKTNVTNTALTIQDDQKKFTDAINAPDTIHYRGVTLSPNGSFIEAATVWRQRAEGSDINTQFSGIPYNGSTPGQLSEFNATGRQSRVALTAEGKLTKVTMRAYYEGDWLASGTTSNDNQSNSYVFRQRQLYAQAETTGGLTMTAGQMWSLVTETRNGLSNKTEATPLVIDPQYTAGFSWARQYGFRLTQNFGNKFWLGASAEAAQTLSLGLGATTPQGLVFQETGNSGGLYNAFNGSYSFNLAPDMIVKAAMEPGWGHWELYGLARFFRDRVYPSTTTSAGAYNDTRVGGGVGWNIRVPTIKKKLDVAFHGLWGDGVGRYGSSTLADATARPNGTLAPLHGGSTLAGLELHATPKLDIYGYYGADYDERAYYLNAKGQQVGYGAPLGTTSTGCNTEAAVAAPTTIATGATSTPAAGTTCNVNNRAVQEITFGYWFDPYRGAKGRFRQSIQYAYFIRNTWQGIGGSPSATDNMFWTSVRYYLP